MRRLWDEPGWQEAVFRVQPLAERFVFESFDIDFSSLSVEKLTWLADKLEERESEAWYAAEVERMRERAPA